MPAIFVTVGFALLALLGGFFQLRLKPVLVSLGYGRVLTPVGNEHCTTVPELQACESEHTTEEYDDSGADFTRTRTGHSPT